MAQSNRQANKQMRNLTREEKAMRIKMAQEREKREEDRKKRAERSKKVLTVVVCIILVLALGIPTMAIQVLSQS